MADIQENTTAKTYYVDKTHALTADEMTENIRQMLFAPMLNTLGHSIETLLLSEGKKLAKDILAFQDEWREKVRKKVKKIKRLEKQLAEKSKEGSRRERGDDGRRANDDRREPWEYRRRERGDDSRRSSVDDSRRGSEDDGQVRNEIRWLRGDEPEEDEKDRLIQELRLKLSGKSLAERALEAGYERTTKLRDKMIKKLREELAALKEKAEKSTNGAARQDEDKDEALASAEKTIADLRELLRKQEDAEALLREDSRRTIEDRDKTINEVKVELRAMKEVWRPQANRQIAKLEAEVSLLKERPDAGRDDQIRELEKQLAELVQLKEEQETRYEVALDEKDEKISEQAEELSKRPTFDDLRQSEGVVEDLLGQVRELEADRTANKSELETLRERVLVLGQTAQPEDPYNDYHHEQNFDRIDQKITSIRRGCLVTAKCNSGWKEFDEIEGVDDRRYFLIAEIADVIARTYFAPDSPKVFGFESRVDESLGALEARLEEKARDEDDRLKIVRWRTLTLELIRSLGPTQVTVHQDLEEELVEKLRPLVIEGDGQIAKLENEVRLLSEAAFQAALAVRACATEYPWPQLSSLSSLPADDVKTSGAKGIDEPQLWIDDWGQDNRIVFAPLYKNVGGEHGLVMIRDGQAMRRK